MKKMIQIGRAGVEKDGDVLAADTDGTPGISAAQGMRRGGTGRSFVDMGLLSMAVDGDAKPSAAAGRGGGEGLCPDMCGDMSKEKSDTEYRHFELDRWKA